MKEAYGLIGVIIGAGISVWLDNRRRGWEKKQAQEAEKRRWDGSLYLAALVVRENLSKGYGFLCSSWYGRRELKGEGILPHDFVRTELRVLDSIEFNNPTAGLPLIPAETPGKHGEILYRYSLCAASVDSARVWYREYLTSMESEPEQCGEALESAIDVWGKSVAEHAKAMIAARKSNFFTSYAGDVSDPELLRIFERLRNEGFAVDAWEHGNMSVIWESELHEADDF